MKQCMGVVETSETTQNSWKNDVFSQVKGPEKKGRIRCMGKYPTSKSFDSPSSQSMDHDEEVQQLKQIFTGLTDEVKGLQGIVASLVSIIEGQVPTEQVANILGAANRFINLEVHRRVMQSM